MTLTTRLSAWFLGSLAVVLAAFSLALLLLARTHLLRQAEGRAASALDALSAAVEVEPDGLEWERRERALPGKRRRDDSAAWVLLDSNGEAIDGAPDATVWLPAPAQFRPGRPLRFTRGGAPWLAEARHLAHPDAGSVVERRSPGKPGEERFARLTFVAAAPLAPVFESLRTLAATLAGVSTLVWLGAALGFRWVCRRALAPVATLTRAASDLPGTPSPERLPAPESRDELRGLALAFNGLLDRLEVAYEREKRFTAEASHQLRTPLAGLLGQLEVALRRERPAGDYRAALASARTQAERLRSLVEQLLYLARSGSDAALPDAEPLQLRAWLAGHVESAWGGHPRAADIACDSGGAECVVLAPPELLGQALDNLIENAAKYSGPGTPIRVSLRREASAAVLAVADRGAGIAPADLGRVFGPFYRGDSARLSGTAGVGLGLAVAARIARALGGECRAESEVGVGSSFELRVQLSDTGGASGPGAGRG